MENKKLLMVSIMLSVGLTLFLQILVTQVNLRSITAIAFLVVSLSILIHEKKKNPL